MLFYLRVYLVKVTTAVFNFFARRLPHDRKAPRVGWAIRNVPYGEDRKNRLDILVPRDVSSPPVVIYFHGGGWISGTKIDRRRICREIAHNGYVVFNVDYRLAPRYQYPVQMVDVARAVRWISGNASRYGGDASRIFLMGESAGAYLACWYAAALGEPALRKSAGIDATIPRDHLAGLFLFYGVYDFTTLDDKHLGNNEMVHRTIGMMTRSFLGVKPGTSGKRAKTSSPALHVHMKNEFPFVFLSAAQADPLYGQSKALAAILKKKGIAHKTLFFTRKEYPNAGHGFLNVQYSRCSRKAMGMVIRVMNRLRKSKGAR
jgi:acetyl esterase/lipase